VCQPGAPLDPTCDPCVAQVCAIDDFCCAVEWDQQCAMGAEQVCGAPCSSGGGGGGGGGGSQCDQCIQELCLYDPYCCYVEWDAQCDQEAQQLCGQVCP
ncbi:MAG: hypothetical protein K8M05_40855, partial [Deltaproteobacteria bacterium]|nr:hypothetical protein [Kofleriaceae bacterium]